MANTLYPSGRNAFLVGDIDWEADDINVTLVDLDDYTYDAGHTAISDVPLAARVATAAITNKTSAAGTADADDTVLTSVTGHESEALIIWKDTGVEATSLLIAYYDSASGLPVTPNGTNITIAWSDGASKIFTL